MDLTEAAPELIHRRTSAILRQRFIVISVSSTRNARVHVRLLYFFRVRFSLLGKAKSVMQEKRPSTPLGVCTVETVFWLLVRETASGCQTSVHRARQHARVARIARDARKK